MTNWLQIYMSQHSWIKNLRTFSYNNTVSNVLEQLDAENPIKLKMFIDFYESQPKTSFFDLEQDENSTYVIAYKKQYAMLLYFVDVFKKEIERGKSLELSYRLTDEIIPLISEYLEIDAINDNTKKLIDKAWDLLAVEYKKLLDTDAFEFENFEKHMATIAELYDINIDELETKHKAIQRIVEPNIVSNGDKTQYQAAEIVFYE
mgnify:FL=1